MQQESSPPPSPPSPDQETKLSRKREREVSLEPATTPKANTDDDVLREQKEARTPAKKNRTQLDPTEEEDDTIQSRSSSGSPPQISSLPQEMKIKVRQISQGVEDLTWRNMKAVTPERDIDIDLAAKHSTINDENWQVSAASNALVGMIDDEATTPTISDNPDITTSSLDVESGDQSLKRKFLERGTSQGPPDANETHRGPVEPLKRLRDDSDKDDNPREAKQPSPPPEPKSPKKPPQATTPKLSGFMAYASPNSPFAAVKGQNIFALNKAPSPPPFIPAQQTPISAYTTSASEASGSFSPFGVKRAGFEAFASSTSPFSSAARSKSPILASTSKLGKAKSPPRRGNPANSNAFSPYAVGMRGFTIPAQKRARGNSPSNSSRSSLERTLGVFDSNGIGPDSGPEDDRDDRPISFGEKLRAGKNDEYEGKSDDEQTKIVLTEQDVLTGEEDEETIHQVRGKLFSLVDGTQWKERGTGTLKLNVRRSDGSGARLVMRKEAVYALLLNVTLFHGMRCALAQDPRYLRFSVIEDGTTTHYNLKLASAKIAQELLEEINANIPTL